MALNEDQENVLCEIRDTLNSLYTVTSQLLTMVCIIAMSKGLEMRFAKNPAAEHFNTKVREELERMASQHRSGE